jgi:hypothetical protein
MDSIDGIGRKEKREAIASPVSLFNLTPKKNLYFSLA